jgi:hypothetical protein
MHLLRKPFTTVTLPSVLLILASLVVCSKNAEAAVRQEVEQNSTKTQLDEKPNFSGQSVDSDIRLSSAVAAKLPGFTLQQGLEMWQALGIFGGKEPLPTTSHSKCFNTQNKWVLVDRSVFICSSEPDGIAYQRKYDENGTLREEIPHIIPTKPAPESEISHSTVSRNKSCK